jgi:peptide deformylase
MAVLDILHVGDPRLREVARPVPDEKIASAEVQRAIDDLIETMRHKNGAGLAATQVGLPWRIVVIEVNQNPRYPYKPRIPLTVAVNPELHPLSDERFFGFEGCLSVPGLRGVVPRWRHLEVRYLDRAGRPHAERVQGLTAGTWQHETDHLDGKVFLDRVVDPTTLTTWENFQRFHEAAWVARWRADGDA